MSNSTVEFVLLLTYTMSPFLDMFEMFEYGSWWVTIESSSFKFSWRPFRQRGVLYYTVQVKLLIVTHFTLQWEVPCDMCHVTSCSQVQSHEPMQQAVQRRLARQRQRVAWLTRCHNGSVRESESVFEAVWSRRPGDSMNLEDSTNTYCLGLFFVCAPSAEGVGVFSSSSLERHDDVAVQNLRSP